MKQFFGTLLIVLAITLLFGTYTWLSDETHKFTIEQHYGYSFIVFGGIACIIWMIVLGFRLINKGEYE